MTKSKRALNAFFLACKNRIVSIQKIPWIARKLENIGLQVKGWNIIFSNAARFVGIFVGVLVTCSCFLLGGLFEPDWQSGIFHDYIGLMLSPVCIWPFYPLMLYSIVALLGALFIKEGIKHPFWMRFGVYTGFFWSFQFLVIYIIVMAEGEYTNSLMLIPIGILATIIPIGAWVGLKKLLSKYDYKKANSVYLKFIILLMIISILAAIYVIICISLPAGPFWTVTLYGWVSIILYRRRILETSNLSPRVMGGIAWLGGYIVAWKISLYMAAYRYSQLPTEPPDCYIATAAARGHYRFVKSSKHSCRNGKSMAINDQLRYLKCAEIVLKSSMPSVHWVIRKVYDFIGPNLAKLLVNSFLADMAYMMLKPVEWLCRVILKVVLGRHAMIARKIYS